MILPSRTRSSIVSAWLLTLWLVSLAGTVSAEEPVTAGFTRPGWPSDKVEGGKIRFVADDKEAAKPALGGTVYAQVLKLAPSANDPWSTGIANFTGHFQAGVDFNGTSSPALDTSAKYLYLYQVVNDRRTMAPIETTAIKLDVDMRDITSWGYFDGVGFGLPADKKAGEANGIRPVSFGSLPAGGEDASRAYKVKAPLNALPDALRLVRIPTKRGETQPKEQQGKIVQVVWDALDPASTPDYVMLLQSSDFENAPSVRAIWSAKNALERNGRSTVFGFTSNLPPTTDLVSIRTTKEASKEAASTIRFVATETEEQQVIRDGIIGAVGKVPTPKPESTQPGIPPFEPAAPPPPQQSAPNLGGPPPSGGGGGVVSTPIRVGGIGAAAIPIIAGGGGSGSGRGSNSGTQDQKQNGQTLINFKATLLNQQMQWQQQWQQQHQSGCCNGKDTGTGTGTGNGSSSSGGNSGNGAGIAAVMGAGMNGSSAPSAALGAGISGGGGGANVVPEPATIVGASLGLPVLMWIWRRRSARPLSR